MRRSNVLSIGVILASALTLSGSAPSARSADATVGSYAEATVAAPYASNVFDPNAIASVAPSYADPGASRTPVAAQTSPAYSQIAPSAQIPVEQPLAPVASAPAPALDDAAPFAPARSGYRSVGFSAAADPSCASAPSNEQSFFDADFSTGSRAMSASRAPSVDGDSSSSAFGVSPFSPLIADVEWLGWQTSGSDRAYARVLNRDGSTSDRDSAPSGSGVRARVGFRADAGWDVVGGFTYFNADKARTANASEAGGFLFNPTSVFWASTDKIDALATTDLQIVDVELGKWNSFGALEYRPFVGARWTQLNDELETSCQYVADEGELLSDAVSSRSKTNAIGARFGAEFRRGFLNNFGVYGRGAGTIASADVKSQTRETLDGAVVGNVSQKRTRAVPSLEAALGAEWKSGPVEFKGGYEFNIWYDATQSRGQKSNFCAHGCFVGASWNH